MLLFYFLFLVVIDYLYSQEPETCENQIFLSTTNFLECQENVESLERWRMHIIDLEIPLTSM